MASVTDPSVADPSGVPPSPAERYDARAAELLGELRRARGAAGRLSALRLLTFAGSVAALATARPATGPARTVAAAIGVALAAAFVVLVRAHRRARSREREGERRYAACVRGAARVRREWAALPVPAWRASVGTPLPPAAEDLGIVGHGSLAQLLDVVTPAAGGPRLLQWLLADPPPAAAIRARQSAVAELAGREDFLEWCAATADAARVVAPHTLERFVRWAEEPPAAHDGAVQIGVMRFAAWAGAALAVVAAVASVAGVPSAGGALGAVLALNTAVAYAVRRRLRPVLAPVADLPVLLGSVLVLMARYDAETVAAPAWRDVQDRLGRGGGGVAAFGRLARLLAWAEVRYSPMLHYALDAFLLWDAHLVVRLERWRRTSGAAVRGWLDAVGDAEALTALATLAHDNPAWVFPTLDDDSSNVAAPTLDADDLGHPLLRPATRVGNPVRLGGAGSLLVISGSNMAGKTTLLRAIGLDVLLAQAGGPACARAMRWRRVRVRTSVRVQDALSEGVSLFLAELRRLREIVDAAGEPAADAPVLYLLDEVLHGTNSRDRQSATRAVLARLHASGAIGVVTTHDLDLADVPALAPDTEHLHFREQYTTDAAGPRMTFDFRARPGRATGANALALLAALGLDAPDANAPDGSSAARITLRE